MMHYLIRYCLCVGMLTAFTGCVNLPTGGSEKARLFNLGLVQDIWGEWRAAAHQKYRPVTWQLTIEEPLADVHLDTDKIIVDKGAFEMTHLSGVRWVERLPVIFHQLILDGFEQAALIPGVGRPIDGLDAEYVLLTDVRSFDLEAPKNQIRLRVTAKLLRVKDREIISTRCFFQKQPTPAQSDEVVHHLMIGANALVQEMIDWAMEATQEADQTNHSPL